MAKKIIILMDGTANEIGKKRTNILRFYGCLKKDADQLVYYDPGVGTFGGDGWASRIGQRVYEVLCMLTGRGLDQNVKDAYRFLVENYEYIDEKTHDEVYLVGFSRGAYSARVLAGFLHNFGLMEPRNLNLLDYAYRSYSQIGEDRKHTFKDIRLHTRTIRPHDIPIDGLILFDTVSSVLRWHRWFWRPINHASTARNPSVKAVRHAVAISERRTMFRPQVWIPDQTYQCVKYKKLPDDPKQDLKEVWFEGVHGDIGGGYPEEVSGLAKIPLYWAIKESEAWGLRFKAGTVNRLVFGVGDPSKVPPEPKAPVNRSMTWFWPLVEFIPRRKPPLSNRWTIFGWTLPLFERRVIPEDALVHAAVLERDKLPPNLPGRYGTEPWSEGSNPD